MTYFAGVSAYRWLHRAIALSPTALLGWVLLNSAIAPTASAASPQSHPPTHADSLRAAWNIDAAIPIASVVAAPNTTVAPQFSPSAPYRQVAQAITPAEDGTGTVVTQTDNTFDITGGTLAGDNLFHSFEQFGLNADQIANILTSPDIENVLGRITGGDASVINGLLQLTGGDANLFLINPAGIIFGPESQVLVPAAFTAATADAVQFDEAWFNAIGANDYASLLGDPTGFAFTSDAPGAIINAGSLESLVGDRITLLGGIVINTGTIETPGGTVTIAAVPGENLVRITQEGSLLSLDLPTQVQAGLNPSAIAASDLPSLLAGGTAPEDLGLVVENGMVKLASTATPLPSETGTAIVSGTVDAADATVAGIGGAVDVTGDRVGLLNATVDVSGTDGGGRVRIGGDYQGQGAIANARRTHIDADSAIAADGLVNGDGGRVIVWADNATSFLGMITAEGGRDGGNGGFVEVSGKEALHFDGQVLLRAPIGHVGQLLLDPGVVIIGSDGTDNSQLDDFTINAADGGLSSTFRISAGRLLTTLNSNDVTIAAAERIDVNEPVDASGSENDLALTAPEINVNRDLVLGTGNLTLTAADSSTTAAQGIVIEGNSFNDVERIATEGGDITFNGPVEVDPFDGLLSISTGFGSEGDVTFNGTLDSQSSLFPSQVNATAGSGDVNVLGDIGGMEALASFEVGSAAAINLRNVVSDRVRLVSTDDISIASDSNLNLPNLILFDDSGGQKTITLSAVDDIVLTSPSISSSEDDLVLNAGGGINVTDLSGSFDFANLQFTGQSIVLDDVDIRATEDVRLQATDSSIVLEQSDWAIGGMATLEADADIVVTSSTVSVDEALSLQAQSTLVVTDAAPEGEATVLQSGDDLQLQGTSGIVIDALDRPTSVFDSGGDLDLISDGNIIGNGRFMAEGDIAIATLADDPGTFIYMPVDSPGIISAEGDVSFGDYIGTALKVEATGSITGGDITITAPNTTAADLPGTDPDIALLANSSALILRAGIGPYQPVNDQLPNLANAQNSPNVTDASPDYTLGANTFSFEGTATVPANITVGDIDTAAANGTVILEAPGNITTGAINASGFTGDVDSGAVAIASGGSVTVANEVDGLTKPATIVTPGQPITISAEDDILVGALDTNGFGNNSSVTLVSEAGDIQIDYIDTGSGGIDITAAGAFRAVDSFDSNAFDPPDGAFFSNDPALVDFLVAQGYDREAVLAGNVFLEPSILLLSLITRPNDAPPGELNGPITIRYGDATREIVNEPVDILGVPSQILILGDSTQPFIVGPASVSFTPSDPANNLEPFDPVSNPNGFDPANPFFFRVEASTPYPYPSEAFPEDTSGLAAGIAIGEGTNLDLYGSLQNQVFEGISDGNGTGGDGTDGGGTDVGSGNGGNPGEPSNPEGDGGTIAANPEEVPPETQNLEADETNDLCEGRPTELQTADEILTIDESLVADVRSPDEDILTADPCNNRDGNNDTVEINDETLTPSP